MNSAKRLVSCTCALRPRLSAAPSRLLRSLPPPSPLHTTSHLHSDGPLPWFVSPDSLPSAPTPAPLATAPVPLPLPSHVPEVLRPLWDHLSISPFLNKEQVRFIDARRLDGGEAWVEWIVVAELRRGRERGLRGAIEGVRRFLSENALNLSPPESGLSLPFAPSSPTITGLPSPPSRHARSRAMKQAGKGPGMQAGEQASGWAMLDSGDVVVHVMTEEARATWGIEDIWDEKERELEQIERKSA